MADYEFADVVRKKFQSLPDLSSEPCIYTAPDHLRAVNEECYRPYVISIGPLHHGHPSLEAMQDCKWRCLKFFLEHDNNSNWGNLEHYLGIVRELEGRVRGCYSESTLSICSREFNHMILIDSAFIICLFMKFHLESSTDLYLMYKRNLLKWEYKLTRDLFLEENQIPFFVLDRLFQEAFGAAYPNISFLDHACEFIKDGQIPVVYKRVIEIGDAPNGKIPVVNKHDVIDASYGATIQRIKNDEKNRKTVHLVDLLRKFCFPPNFKFPTLQEQAQQRTSSTNFKFPTLQEQAQQRTSSTNFKFPTLQEQAQQRTSSTNFKFPSSVSNLKAAKVKFVPSQSTNLLDVSFSKGVLKIPPFELWDVTESYFRSIILYEQSHQPIINSSVLHHYILLLENLIRTPEDVQILVQSGIIRNWIGNEETIARLFNGDITRHIPLPVNFCYSGVCQGLNKYANTRWNKYRAILKRDYFSHPWAAMSLIYALILLLLSLLQTIGTFTKK